MKLTFLGIGSALCNAFNSNAVLEINNSRLLIDAGTDIKHSLRAANLSENDINAIYLTHIHADHAGGMEYLAFKAFFNQPQRDLILIGQDKVLKGLDLAIRHTAVYDPNVNSSLGTYFILQLLGGPGTGISPLNDFFFQNVKFTMVKGSHSLPVYGLTWKGKTKRFYYTGDSALIEHPWYEEADVIFQDCQVGGKPNDAHAHYDELVKLPANIRKNMWLYHYNPDQPLPDAKRDGFAGFVQQGQVFED